MRFLAALFQEFFGVSECFGVFGEELLGEVYDEFEFVDLVGLVEGEGEVVQIRWILGVKIKRFAEIGDRLVKALGFSFKGDQADAF